MKVYLIYYAHDKKNKKGLSSLSAGHTPEKKMKDVLRWYLESTDFQSSKSRELLGITYNTYRGNFMGNIHIKVDLILKVGDYLFPEKGPQVFPEISKDVVKYLSYSEMYARLFAAQLDDNKEFMKEVGQMLIELSESTLPPLPELPKKSGTKKDVR